MALTLRGQAAPRTDASSCECSSASARLDEGMVEYEAMALRSRHFTLPGSHCALRRRFRGGPPYEDIAFKIVNNECESPPTYICMHTHAYTRTHVHTAYMYMCIRACAHMCIGGSSRISGVSSPALSVASSSCTLASSAIATGAEHCTLHVAGCTLHAARCTLHAARCALHAARCRIHAAGYTLQDTRCRLQRDRYRHRR